MKKRLIIGLLVGATVFAGVFAMAASLGITSDGLAAGDQNIGRCDTAVSTTYTTAYDGTTNNRYEIASVVVSGVDDATCLGQKIQVTVGQTGGTAVTSTTQTVAAATTSYTFSFAEPGRPSAALADDIHVLIAN